MLKPKNLNFLSFLIFIGIIATFLIFLLAIEKAAAEAFFGKPDENALNLPVFQGTTFLPQIPFSTDSDVAKTIEVIVTAYSSTVWETDDFPLITASGETVRDGIIANNMLAFGTKVRLPELYGDKVFIVKDRMNSRKSDYHIDIWQPSHEQATEFGAKFTEMEVLVN